MWSNTNVWNEFNGSLNRHGARDVRKITKMIPNNNKFRKSTYTHERVKNPLLFESETPNRSGAQNNPITNYDGMEIYKKKYFDFLDVQPLSTDWQTLKLNYEMPDYEDVIYKANVAQARRDGIREDVIKVRFVPPLKMVKSSLQQSVGNLNQLIPFIIKAKEVDAIKTQLDQDIIMRALSDSKSDSLKLYTMLLNQNTDINKNLLSLTQLIDMATNGARAPPPVGDQGIELQPDQDMKDNLNQPAGQVLIRPGQDVKDNTPDPNRPDDYFIDPSDTKEDIDALIKKQVKDMLDRKDIVTFDKIFLELQRSILLTITDTTLIKKFEDVFKQMEDEKNTNQYGRTRYNNAAYKLIFDLLDKNYNNKMVRSIRTDIDQIKNIFKTNIQPIITAYMTANPVRAPTPTRGRPKGSKDSKKRNSKKGKGMESKIKGKHKKIKPKIIKQNKWIDHVKMYCDKHQCSWAEGLKRAKDSY